MESVSKYAVQELQWPEKYFIGKNAELPFDQLSNFFRSTYGQLYAKLNSMGLKPKMPFAFYYKIDEAANSTRFAAVVELSAPPAEEVEDFETIVLPASQLVKTTYFGSYDSMMPAYEALKNYCSEHQLTPDFAIEEYLTDPSREADPAKWQTNIYFRLK